MGDQEKAKQAREKVADDLIMRSVNYPGGHGDYFKAAEIYEKSGDQTKAIEMWKEITRHYKEDQYEGDKVAIAYEKLGQIEKAQEAWRNVAKDYEEEMKIPLIDISSCCKGAGEAYAKAGDISRAKELLERAVKSSLKYLKTTVESQGKTTELDKQELRNIEFFYNEAAESCLKLAEIIKKLENAETENK